MNSPLTQKDPTHASLLNRLAKSPSPTAWEEFHERYGRLVSTYCRRIGLLGVESEDLCQSVFQGLLKTLPNFQYSKVKGGFRAYLWRVVRNQALAMQHKTLSAPTPASSLVEDLATLSQDPDDVWEDEWRKCHYRLAFEQLTRETTPRYIQIFEQYAIENAPAADVAKRDGCSVDLVYKIKSNLTARLKQLVQEQIELEG